MMPERTRGANGRSRRGGGSGVRREVAGAAVDGVVRRDAAGGAAGAVGAAGSEVVGAGGAAGLAHGAGLGAGGAVGVALVEGRLFLVQFSRVALGHIAS